MEYIVTEINKYRVYALSEEEAMQRVDDGAAHCYDRELIVEETDW